MTTIRRAEPRDIPAVHALIHELATYEREPDAVVATEADLDAALFGPQPAVFAHVAEVDGEVAGFALWFLTYSTWEGRHGIHLEDLYVREEHRGSGLGGALLRTLARTAVDNGWRRVEWAVLTWNEPAIGFYRAIGAVELDAWRTNRLDGDALARYAGQPEQPEQP